MENIIRLPLGDAPLIYPGTPEFLSLLKKFHGETCKILDKKVKSGAHEPGHDSAHVEMTLYFFQKISRALNFPDDKRDVGAMAAILHDIWRENIYHSHVKKSAEKAKRILEKGKLIRDENVRIPENIRDLIVAMVASHSINSDRSESATIPREWQVVLMALQAADLLASQGPFGYLRSFSYSGHVLKSMLDRIKVVVKNPKKYQDPLPVKLKRLLSDSNNPFHEWILAIMKRTNRNFVEKLDEKRIIYFVTALIDAGVDPAILAKYTGFRTSSDDSKQKEPLEDESFFVDIMALIEKNALLASYFDTIIDHLDSFAVLGLHEDGSVDNDVENDVINLLEYSIPGICSRAFWGQFNPSDDSTDEKYIPHYLTLYERIQRFSKMLASVENDPAKAGIRTEEGKIIFQKICSLCIALVTGAQEQYQTQRWTVEMWDGL
ncbi:MAG: HD domain-containing protein [bacterium]|nr:HD domain-containing protein [bacterium]